VLVEVVVGIAFTTRSTGITSTTASAIPGNSGSAPRPYARMIGSAMRKPRTQPGAGSLSADSMIEGRTIVIENLSRRSDTAISASAFVKE
jgi:hypothetical protein